MTDKIDTSAAAVADAWDEFEISAKPLSCNGDTEFFDVQEMCDRAFDLHQINKALAAERDALRAERVDITEASAGAVVKWVETIAECDTLRAEVERLTTLIDAALDASTIEINPSNYDHDQVCLLNAEMTEVCSILEAALKGGDA